MTIKNEDVGILHGDGESKILLRRPYGIVKMARQSHFTLISTGIH